MSIEAVISTLCERFGVTTKYLIQEMARFYTVSSAVGMILSAICLIGCIVVLRKAVSMQKNTEDMYVTDIGIGIGVFSTVAMCISFTIFVVNCYNLICILISPTGAIIERMLSMIGG